MAERTFTWPEGTVYLWTGSALKSAIAFASETDANLVIGYVNQQAGSAYHNYATGQRVDVTIGALYTNDGTIDRIFDSRTAVHMKIEQKFLTGLTASAGMLFWSGAIDGVQFRGSDGQSFSYQMRYHANIWSAYGT